MPNRSVLNKYALFTTEVQKLGKKKEISKSEQEIVDRARIFALLSSSHCWHIYRFMHGEPLNKEAVVDEALHAISESWKDITEDEIREVMSQKIEEYTFSLLLMNLPIPKEDKMRYKSLLPLIKQEFADGLEPIEREEE